MRPSFLRSRWTSPPGCWRWSQCHHPAGPVAMGQPAQAVAAQGSVDGRARHVQLPGEAMRALAAASHQHPTHLTGREGMGGGGPRAAVGQPGLTRLAVAAQPLVGGGPRHPQGLGGLGWGQPSSVMRWTSSSRPTSVRRASAWAMRVPSRLGVSTTQADPGDPQLSTTLTATTPSGGDRVSPGRAAGARAGRRRIDPADYRA
jgi:hypothetical protein